MNRMKKLLLFGLVIGLIGIMISSSFGGITTPKKNEIPADQIKEYRTLGEANRDLCGPGTIFTGNPIYEDTTSKIFYYQIVDFFTYEILSDGYIKIEKNPNRGKLMDKLPMGTRATDFTKGWRNVDKNGYAQWVDVDGTDYPNGCMLGPYTGSYGDMYWNLMKGSDEWGANDQWSSLSAEGDDGNQLKWWYFMDYWEGGSWFTMNAPPGDGDHYIRYLGKIPGNPTNFNDKISCVARDYTWA